MYVLYRKDGTGATVFKCKCKGRDASEVTCRLPLPVYKLPGRNTVKLICINKQEHYLSGVNQTIAAVIKKYGTGATVSPESRCNGSNGSGVQQLQTQLHLSLQVGSSAGRSASKPVSYYPTRLPRSLNIHHKIAAQRGSSDAGRGFPSAPRVVNLRLLRLLQFTL